MLVFFFIIFFLYFLFILLMLYGWGKATNQSIDNCPPDFLPFISVIIAVRNEEKNIPKLLKCLSSQSYPKDQYEVIIIDDHSEDNTVRIINNASNFMENVSLLKTNFSDKMNISPKKSALLKGIDASEGDIIVMTDGDCWFGEDWIKAIASAFYNEKTMFVAGPVAIKGDRSLLSKIQTLEFSSLIGTGGALIRLNYPLFCNGANLAFRKKTFYEVNGYKGYEDNSSGDDVFLMQKIHNSYKNSIVFQKDQRAIVYTFPQPSISGLIHQRIRWASKWNKYVPTLSWFLPVFLFVLYVSFLAGVISIFLIPQFLWKVGLLILIKIILDYLILKKVMFFCKLRFDFWVFLLSEFLYPFYAFFIGILVHFGNFRWKGRLHKVK